jgi:lipopolysaccharide biosynthesis glycosyltransferase
MISDKPDMVFNLEHMMRSVKKHSGDRKIAFSVIVNGNSIQPLTGEPKLTKRLFHNAYINSHAEVYDCPQHWTMHVPSRWFIEPKMEQCVFIDTDIITCNDLTPLYNLRKDTFYGVQALKNPLSQAQWQQIDVTSNDLKSYFNFGMLVVPGQFMKKIGFKLIEKLPIYKKQFKEAEYYAAQIALCTILKELDIKRVTLPKEFNWLDLNPEPQNFKNILFLHYLIRREQAYNSLTCCSMIGDGYSKIIAESARYFYGRKIFS